MENRIMKVQNYKIYGFFSFTVPSFKYLENQHLSKTSSLSRGRDHNHGNKIHDLPSNNRNIVEGKEVTMVMAMIEVMNREVKTKVIIKVTVQHPHIKVGQYPVTSRLNLLSSSSFLNKSPNSPT